MSEKSPVPPADSNHTEDFVWRFRLDEKPRNPKNMDPLLELVRVQWEELLKLAVPMQGNVRVKIDGFALLRDLDTVHPIFEDDPRWRETK